MKRNMNRRLFLKRTALSAAALPAAGLLPLPNLLAAARSPDKLNCVQIGCGGRGMNHLDAVVTANKQNLVAVVDVFEPRLEAVRKWLAQRNQDASKVQTFTDYRKMFDALGKDLDVVFIATPNHQHALPSMIAMQLGKGVFCEKPDCHDIGEARRLRPA